MSYGTTETKMLAQTEAALMLGIEPRTLEAWRLRRIGPRFFSYSKRCVRYRASDLANWLNEHAVDMQTAAA